MRPTTGRTGYSPPSPASSSYFLRQEQRRERRELDLESPSSSTAEGGPSMPVNLWGMDRRDVWRTCFCFHVRTVTIFIGVWHLMLYILALSFVAAVVMYDQNHDDGYLPSTPKPDPLLPTPQSKVHEARVLSLESPKYEPLTIDHRTLNDEDSTRARIDGMRNGPWNFVMDSRKANSQMILLTVCNMMITLLMVYGAVRGRPSYLMPFFVLKVFDFCIFCLTMVGYFSYLPDVTQVIINQPGLPFRDELLKMDPQLLSLLTLILIVSTIAFKAYIIGVIWNCYKYLMLRNTVIRGVIAYRHDDPQNIMGMQQNLLPDLPDYETAINDPRYAKKPPMDPNSSSGNTPAIVNVNSSTATAAATQTQSSIVNPPPYSMAVQISEAELNIEQQHQQHQQQEAPPPTQQQSTETIVEQNDVEQDQGTVDTTTRVIETKTSETNTESSTSTTTDENNMSKNNN